MDRDSLVKTIDRIKRKSNKIGFKIGRDSSRKMQKNKQIMKNKKINL